MGRQEPGYRPEPKIYRLTFDDHPGLWVRAKSVDAGTFLEISALADDDGVVDDVEMCKLLLAKFSRVLVTWNLEYWEDGPLQGPEGAEKPAWLEGDPVPMTRAGLLTQDFDLIMAIIQGWMQATAGVSVPLAQPSSGGRPSLVESLPMVPLSPSRVS